MAIAAGIGARRKMAKDGRRSGPMIDPAAQEAPSDKDVLEYTEVEMKPSIEL